MSANSFSVKAYGAESLDNKVLTPITIQRRNPGPKDIKFEVLYCGVCHSDIHTAYGEWKNADGTPNTKLPCVPGHEIVGKVTELGSEVSNFKVGDVVGVGCLVDSCRTCPGCADGEEQMCFSGFVGTYNGEEKAIGGHTYGGYSTDFVVQADFAIRIPESLQSNLAAAAPLLCAGITTYSPLRAHNVGPGMTVGVVGLGGLGHMAVKLAKAMGAKVVLFTTSPSKIEDGLKLGASEVVVSKDPEQMKKHARSIDLIIDCVSADHNINEYLMLLNRRGKVVLVGAPENPLSVAAFALIVNNVSLGGSGIGGIKETQEMIDFCGEHGIFCEIEMIKMDQINEAFDRVVKADVKYRFVIDMASLKN